MIQIRKHCVGLLLTQNHLQAQASDRCFYQPCFAKAFDGLGNSRFRLVLMSYNSQNSLVLHCMFQSNLRSSFNLISTAEIRSKSWPYFESWSLHFLSRSTEISKLIMAIRIQLKCSV